jgi:hypothetical protein
VKPERCSRRAEKRLISSQAGKIVSFSPRRPRALLRKLAVAFVAVNVAGEGEFVK